MAVTIEDLLEYVGVSQDELRNEDWATEFQKAEDAFAVSVIEVDDVLSKAYRPVPATVRDRLVLEVGFAYFKRADSPTGASQGVDYSSGQPVMGPKDPLQLVWPIVRRYVLPF